jgi:hypothetical protein
MQLCFARREDKHAAFIEWDVRTDGKPQSMGLQVSKINYWYPMGLISTCVSTASYV